MVKRRTSLFLGFILFFAFCGLAGAAEISLTIRYYDMRVFFLDRDPIWVQVTLTNNGPDAFRFKLADERAFSMDFDVRTTANRPVEAADALLRRRSSSQQVYFREISIEAGESFSFVENLRDYAFLDKSGAYVVQAAIYPELFRSGTGGSYGTGGSFETDGTGGASPLNNGGPEKVPASFSTGNSLLSNRLGLTIRPPLLAGPDGVPLALDVETNAVLVREKLPPDEVVSYALTARQKEQWEKYFLYLDLEAMLSRDAYRRRQWLAESEEGRQRMINRYRTELQSAAVDRDIAAIPMNFIIERTQYNVDEGTVTALEYFRVGNYTERKRYTYYLRRRDSVWSIVDYSVVNLGTE